MNMSINAFSRTVYLMSLGDTMSRTKAPRGPGGRPSSRDGGDALHEPVHLLLGDVVGKGVAASLLQSHLHALFRALVTPETPLGELLVRANRLFCEATAGASYARPPTCP